MKCNFERKFITSNKKYADTSLVNLVRGKNPVNRKNLFPPKKTTNKADFKKVCTIL